MAADTSGDVAANIGAAAAGGIAPDPTADVSGKVTGDRYPAANPAVLFRAHFATRPAGVWSAPGRVNLIGEHTDYNGGLVLPFAIGARAHVALGPGGSAGFRVVSAQRNGIVAIHADDLRPDAPAARGWPAYPLGVLWSLREAGYDIPPLDLALDSAVPAGAGLSSSAAVECAVALAVCHYLGLDSRFGLDRPALARIAQRAENDFVGVPCGLMDQMASMAATAGHALFLDLGAGGNGGDGTDARSGPRVDAGSGPGAETVTVEQIPFDPVTAGLRVLAIDTHAHHALADGEYARRRAECEQAARALGVDFLSRIGPTDLPAALTDLPDPALRGRVRHVVTENERVRRVVRLLRDGRTGEIGAELSASHASLRDDFQVSCAELDVAAASAERAGALGARMVGGGFGGSVVTVVPAGRVAAVRQEVVAAFAAHAFATPTTRVVTPAEGARRDR